MESTYLAEFKEGHSAIQVLDQICTTLGLPVRWLHIQYRRSTFLEPLVGFHFEVEVERIEYCAPYSPEPRTLRLLVACRMSASEDQPNFGLIVNQILHVNNDGKLVGLSNDDLTIWLLGQTHKIRRGRGVLMGDFRQALGNKLSESLTGPLDTLSIPEVTS